MSIDESKARMLHLLREAGFQFDSPDPALAWEVFKRFSHEPVQCASDYVFFEASDGIEELGGGGYFDFVRGYEMRLPDDQAPVWHEQLTVHFTNQLPDRLEIKSVVVQASKYPDRQAFFRAVEQSPEFRKGLAYPTWSVEVRLDGC